MTNQNPPLPKMALVVDANKDTRMTIIESLEQNGIATARGATNGKMAWDSMEHDPYDLIVMDWVLSGAQREGVSFFNKLRRHKKYQDIPVIVMTGSVKDQEFRLLDDFILVRKLQKPFEFTNYATVLNSLLAEQKWLEHQQEIIVAAFAAVEIEPKNLMSLMREILEEAPNPLPFVAIAATHLRTHGYFNEAEQLLNKILQKNPVCITAMTELSRIYLEKKDYAKASELLQKAQDLSPDNVNRICMLGNLKLSMSSPQEAEKLFDKALVIDPECDDALVGKELANSINQYIAVSPKDTVPPTLAGLLNAVGVSMVKQNQFQKGIDHYLKALNYMDEPQTRSRLAFNLGLAYERWDKLDEALKWQQKATEWAGGNYEKAKNQIERIEKIKAKAVADAKAKKEAEEKTKEAAKQAEKETAKQTEIEATTIKEKDEKKSNPKK